MRTILPTILFILSFAKAQINWSQYTKDGSILVAKNKGIESTKG